MTSKEVKEVINIDIVIVGAGISGISMAYYIQKNCPNKKFIILEGRERLGGTWDVFQYPGIRSDSDMYTFGFSFLPWIRNDTVSEGKYIVDYLYTAANKFNIYNKIQFSSHVQSASWLSEDSKWYLNVYDKVNSKNIQYQSQFLLLCTGYFDHDAGYDPDFPGKQNFKGLIVHPQKWPKDLDYSNKNIIIIGSGATAVTLLPSLAPTAKHVTMLQRSPTYIASIPCQQTSFEKFLYRYLPQTWAYSIIRWVRVFDNLTLYWLARKFPKETANDIKKAIRGYLGNDYDVDKHFSPNYDPWDQRFCVCLDGDFFKAISNKQASVVTDTIDHFTENGIQVSNGEVLPADIIITATGLNLQVLGGIKFDIDGQPLKLSSSMIYKGAMFTGVPNLSWTMGYTNSSFTLKSDLVSEYMCRVIKYMDYYGYKSCKPVAPNDGSIMANRPLITALNSGYLTRSNHLWPKQGNKAPFVYHNDYAKDYFLFKYSSIADSYLQFNK